MRYVIVGNSAAGLAAVRSIRAEAPAAEVAMVSAEEGPAYSRVLTSYYLSGRITEAGLQLVDEAFYRQLDVDTLFGRRVVCLSADADELTISDGTRLAFDRLLLATGGSAQRLAVRGGDLPGVFTLRTKADAVAIRRHIAAVRGGAPGSEQAVVIGGGFVSLKAAEALYALGLAVTLVVSSERVLSQMLDPVSAELVREYLDGLGISVLTGDEVSEILPVPGGEGGGLYAGLVVTRSGRELPCGVVIVGKGVRPNTEVLAGSGVKTGRGVIVDEYLRTSRPGVFAAGDVAEAFDPSRGNRRVNALWSNAVEQGRIAGVNMADAAGEGLAYPGAIAENSLHWQDLSVIALGHVTPPADDSAYRVYERRQGSRFYRRLVFRGARLVGAVLYGDVRGAGILRTLILTGADGLETDGYAAELLAPNFNYGRLMRRLLPSARRI